MDGVVGDYMKTRWCEMRQRDEKCASKESYDVQGACHVSTKQPCDASLSREIYWMILVLSCKQDKRDHSKDQDTKEQKKLTLKTVCDYFGRETSGLLLHLSLTIISESNFSRHKSPYPACARSARARKACALRALGLLRCSHS